MGKIILARHGEDKDNEALILNGRRNEPLTLKGLGQAVLLGMKFLDTNNCLEVEHVFCSQLTRAKQTAVICATMLGVPFTPLDFLIERSHGILEGRPFSDIPLFAKAWREVYGSTYVLEVEGGEGYPELCERAKDVLCRLRGKIEEVGIKKDVLVISHGAISRAMTIVHAGLTHEDIFNAPSFDNCEYRVLE